MYDKRLNSDPQCLFARFLSLSLERKLGHCSLDDSIFISPTDFRLEEQYNLL